jgi:PKD repeat protein
MTTAPIGLQIPSPEEQTLYQAVGDEWQAVPDQVYGNGYVTGSVSSLGHFALGTPTPSVTAVATANVLEAPAPALVGFSAAGSTVEAGSLESFSWDFGDGTVGTGPAPQHVYERAGDYTAVVSVVSDQGATDRAEVDVRVDELPPSVGIEAPAEGEVGVPLVLTGRAASPHGSIADSAWDFGDGTGAQGQIAPSHTYSAPGRYPLTFTVADQDGTMAQTSATVSIVAPGSRPVDPPVSSPGGAAPAPSGQPQGGQPQMAKVRCKKGRVRKRGKCVRRKQRHHKHRHRGD